MADPGQQTTDFAVPPFVEHDPQLCGPLDSAADFDAPDLGPALRQADAVQKHADLLPGRLSRDDDVVRLFDTELRMGQTLRERTVVSHDDQPFAGLVESPDGEDPRRGRNQIDDAQSSLGVGACAEDADRLEEGEVLPSPDPDLLAVQADLLRLGIDLQADFGHHLPVHFDSPFADQRFAFATAGDTGGREDLVQALERGRGFGIVTGKVQGRLREGGRKGMRTATARERGSVETPSRCGRPSDEAGERRTAEVPETIAR